MNRTSPRQRINWTLAVIVLALVPRLAATWMLRNTPAGPDALEDYLPMAESLLNGQGFLNAAGQPDSVRGPAYALLVAAVQKFAGSSLLPVRAAQSLLDSLTAALILSLGTRLWSRSIGIIGALLYAFHPLVIYSTSIIGPESLFAFLFTASSWLYLTALGTPNAARFFGAGAVLALATLSRATTMLLIVPWVLLVPFGAGAAKGWLNRCAIVVGFVVVTLPWTIRNYAVFHEFIPVAANAGTNLYAGSSKQFFVPPPEHHVRRRERAEELVQSGAVPPRPEQTGPGAGDRYNLQLGWANYRSALRENPSALVRFLAMKFGMLWYATQSGSQQSFTLLVNAIYGGAAMIGLILGLRDVRSRRSCIAIAVTIVYFVAVLTALYPLARYVIGFTSLLCLLAAVPLSRLIGRALPEGGGPA